MILSGSNLTQMFGLKKDRFFGEYQPDNYDAIAAVQQITNARNYFSPAKYIPEMRGKRKEKMSGNVLKYYFAVKRDRLAEKNVQVK